MLSTRLRAVLRYSVLNSNLKMWHQNFLVSHYEGTGTEPHCVFFEKAVFAVADETPYTLKTALLTAQILLKISYLRACDHHKPSRSLFQDAEQRFYVYKLFPGPRNRYLQVLPGPITIRSNIGPSAYR
jgi:hypothetical protein